MSSPLSYVVMRIQHSVLLRAGVEGLPIDDVGVIVWVAMDVW
jgi:hypothetical protein